VDGGAFNSEALRSATSAIVDIAKEKKVTPRMTQQPFICYGFGEAKFANKDAVLRMYQVLADYNAALPQELAAPTTALRTFVSRQPKSLSAQLHDIFKL